MGKRNAFLIIFIIIFFVQAHLVTFAVDAPLTFSPSCILIERDSGRILYEKNAHEIRFPASTTKIMTAILTIENCRLDDNVTVSRNAVLSVPQGYTHAALRAGERLTAEQLLNVLLISSANDAAFVLAEHISGSTEEFAALMNDKAKEIGCLNTHFVNPNGIHNENHTSTAYDLALMGRYAMQYPVICDIVGKTRCALPSTDQYNKDDRVFVTTNDLIKKNSGWYYPYADGIKTGFTSQAGSCIVASAEKNGIEIIAVVLGGGFTKDGYSERNSDCITLFEFVFENYSLYTLHEQNSVLQHIKVKGATKQTKNLNVAVRDKISILLPNEVVNLPQPEIKFNDGLKAPIAAGSVLGKITYEMGGVIYSSELIAQTDAEVSAIFPFFVWGILSLIALWFVFSIFIHVKKHRKRKQRIFKS